jgi:UDP-N-acetyl-D-glucosamine dehydrogenase
VGVAFKPNIDDARNSPAERIIELLLSRGAEVNYHDPYVPTFSIGGDVFLPERVNLASVPLTEAILAETDCAVIATGHHDLDYDWIARQAPLIVDSCNATSVIPDRPSHIVRLGAPT